MSAGHDPADGAERPSLLTRRGGTLAGATAGLLVGSRLLGADELAVLAVAGIVIIGAAVAWTRLRRVRLVARRVQQPARLQVGGSGRIELELTNLGRRPTPLLLVADGFDDGRRAARFLVAPVAPGATVRAAYRVPTTRRGRFHLGPLVASVTDPFGIARREWPIEGMADVVVCPRVQPVVAPGAGTGREPGPAPDAGGRGLVHDEQGEFRTLRDYEVGDELRRVHWRTSARTGRLVVRQDETPWLPRVTLVLDVRPFAYDDRTFETAVEAAASVAASLRRERRPLTVVTGTGLTLAGAGPDAPHALLEQLATLEPDGPDRLAHVLARLRRRRDSGLVVAIVGRLDADSALALTALSAHTTVVAVAVHDQPDPRQRPPFLVVDATRHPFQDAWNQAIRQWTSVAASSRRLPSLH
ncbi:MAG TPA: DUF58 domain-containing protein [Acidimicrobiia bacterium]|nr:DUF58 domain-containing protein [Acidimicrobiia bacterium]